MSERESGTISFFDRDRSFGFCIPACGSESDRTTHLFVAGPAVRRSGIESLNTGDKISFVRVQNRQRPGKFEVADIALVEKAAA